MTAILFKLKIIMECVKLFKNWYIYPAVYFRFVKKSTISFYTRNHLKITLRTKSTDLMALTNVWLTQEYSKPGFEIRDDDVIIDIGAHIGLFALLISKKCESGKILCFEPILDNYELLLKNLHDNHISNVHPVNIAVSDREQKIKIYLNSDQAGHSIYLESASYVDVQSTTLKKIIDENRISKCSLLKIDCEGAEYEIIESLPDQYLNKIHRIIIEYHFADVKSDLLDRLVQKLRTNFFTVDLIRYSEGMGLIYAKKI